MILKEEKNTIKIKTEIDKLFKTGKKLNCFPVTVIYLKNNTEDNRYLFTCFKNAGKANVRNSIKRKLREISRKLNDKGFDIALIGDKSLIDITNYSIIIAKINKGIK